MQLQDNKSDELTPEEKSAVKLLLNSNLEVSPNEDDGDVVNLSFAERVTKKRKTDSTQSTYVDFRFILPTTNIVERLFLNLATR